VGYFFSLGGDLVYSSIVLAPLCGDVHKRRVYIGVFLEEDGILDPDPCKVCSPPPFSWKWKRVVASSWKWNSDPGVYVVPGYFDVVRNLDAQLCCVALLHLASKVLKVCYLLAWLFASTVFAYPLLIVNACLGQHGCSAVNEIPEVSASATANRGHPRRAAAESTRQTSFLTRPPESSVGGGGRT